MKTVEEPTDKEILKPGQRVGEVISLVIMLLVFGFFADHQAAHTGFYTAKFGAMEMVCLYGPMLLSLAAPVVRAVTGRRNPARPFEIVTNLFLAIAAVYLLLVFPFNFAHLADALPASLCFLLAWVSDGIGRAVLILQIILGAIWAVVTMVKYLSVRRRESAPPFMQQPS